MEPQFERRYLPLRRVDWRIVAGFIAANTILLFFYRQLEYVANALHRPPLLTLAEEATGGLAGFLVFPLCYLVTIRFPFPSLHWKRNVLVHLAAVCGISIIHTTLIAILRPVLFFLFRVTPESYGDLLTRYPMEFSHLFIYYWVGVSLVCFFHEVHFSRERELHAARLQSSLAEAKLQNLRLQLEPHFLFNALNAISAAIYEDPRIADEMIGRLSELLRRLMKDESPQLIPLETEIEILQLYTRIMEARFEDRLAIDIDVDEKARHSLVPHLILQPLVENAIRHGMDSRFKVNVCVHAHREADALVLEVRDQGPGLDDSKPLTFGVGLKNTTDRLQYLFGAGHTFELRNAAAGGAIARLSLPQVLT